jgi:hypothetical protein
MSNVVLIISVFGLLLIRIDFDIIDFDKFDFE